MSERIDYLLGAEQELNSAKYPRDVKYVEEHLTKAGIYATLALVEQQRIANLMTYSAWSSKDVATMDSSMVAEIEEAIGV